MPPVAVTAAHADVKVQILGRERGKLTIQSDYYSNGHYEYVTGG